MKVKATMLKNLRIGAKFNLILLLGTSFFLLFVLPILGSQLRVLTKQFGVQRLEEETTVIQNHFADAERELQSLVAVLASAPGLGEAVKRDDEIRVRQILLFTAAPFEQIDEFDLITVEGEQVFSLGEDGMIDEEKNALLTLALEGEPQLGITVKHQASTAAGKDDSQGHNPPIYLTAAVPVYDSSGVIVGALSIGQQLDDDYLAHINFSRSQIHLLLFRGTQLIAQHIVPDHSVLPPTEADLAQIHLTDMNFIDPEAITRAENGEVVYINEFVTIESSGNEHLIVYMPFYVDDEIAGAMVLLFNVGNLAVFQTQFTQNLAILVTIFVILTALGIILFTRRAITIPIRNLAQVAEQFTTGDLTVRAPVGSNDEIGFLARSFNKMADELAHVFADLEARVANRTQALRQTNEKLTREVAERLAVEAALKESEDQLRQVYASISDHIYVTEITRKGRPVNRFLSPTEPLTGYPVEVFLTDWGFWPTQVIHPDDRAFASGQAKRLAAGQDSEIEYRLVRSDGTIIWVRDSARIEPDSETGATVIYGVVSDITERKEAEAALAKAYDQASIASQLKSELLANVSHELRTPLGAILGYVELLKKGVFGSINDKQATIADEVIDSTHYLTNLVDELLEQARIERGQITIYEEPFSLRQIMRQVEAKMLFAAVSKGLTFNTHIEETLPDELIGDPQRVQQIMINLTNNAIKFTQEGSVRLTCDYQDESHWVIEVADTGPGIPKQAQAYIFEPFRQVDGSITRKHGGTGLGLSIVRQIVAAMNGEVVVKSAPGQGATFIITLPLKIAQERMV